MKLDLRNPSLVITGAWNPAIFSPHWVASHVFDVPKNSVFNIKEIGIPTQGKIITYFGSIGLFVSPERFEVFLERVDEATHQSLASFIERVAVCVPHTPVAGYGINFAFFEASPSDDLLDLFETKEKLEQHRKIQGVVFKTTMETATGAALTLTRIVNDESLVFDFNYHYSCSMLADIAGNVATSFDSCLADAKRLMSEVYALNDFDFQIFELSTEKNAEEGV